MVTSKIRQTPKPTTWLSFVGWVRESVPLEENEGTSIFIWKLTDGVSVVRTAAVINGAE